MKRSLIAFVAMTCIASGAFAKDPVGIKVIDFSVADTESRYLECVGEYVSGYYLGQARVHEFLTPSGVYHFVDNWSFKRYFVGVNTGRVWIGDAVSPSQTNARLSATQVQQWTSEIIYRLEGESAPAFKYHYTFKMTVNANGEPVVLRDSGDVSLAYKCLGPGK